MGAARHAVRRADRRDRRQPGRRERRLPRPRRHRAAALDPCSTFASRARSSSGLPMAAGRASPIGDRRPALSLRAISPSPSGSRRRRMSSRTSFAIGVVNLFLAVGLAAIVSSRIVIGVLIVWNSVDLAHPASRSTASAVRASSSTSRRPSTSRSTTRPIGSPCRRRPRSLILAVWAAVFAGLGRYWTERRDAYGRSATSRRGRSCGPARSSSAPSALSASTMRPVSST